MAVERTTPTLNCDISSCKLSMMACNRLTSAETVGTTGSPGGAVNGEGVGRSSANNCSNLLSPSARRPSSFSWEATASLALAASCLACSTRFWDREMKLLVDAMRSDTGRSCACDCAFFNAASKVGYVSSSSPREDTLELPRHSGAPLPHLRLETLLPFGLLELCHLAPSAESSSAAPAPASAGWASTRLTQCRASRPTARTEDENHEGWLAILPVGVCPPTQTCGCDP